MRRTARASALTVPGSPNDSDSAIAAREGAALMLVDAGARQRGQLHRLFGQGIVPGLDVGIFQDVTDLGVQAAARIADVAGIFAVFGMAAGPK